MADSRKVLRDTSTDEGRVIWRRVDQAAAKAPKWIRERVKQAPMGQMEAQPSVLAPGRISDKETCGTKT